MTGHASTWLTERLGIEVVQVFEGGPEVRLRIAVARGGRWVEP